ncbi:O-antigen ligase family protein [Enterococcus faecium]|uniref:O-antigen ligase family protein n=1 Tax=Enterococcus faecium TaxID=1352 RepID=UPI002DB6C11A|nr:O-antigen ligase family protein [Enterococcus faecium]MEB7868898.1 O-antigen ligase family protein [Enterococcus faecium]
MKHIGNINKNEKIDIVVKCLGFYFLMMPFDSFPMFGMGSLLKIVVLLPIFSIFCIHKNSKIKINKLTLIFFIYVLANIITCFYSVNIEASFSELKRLLLNSLVIFSVGGVYVNYTARELKYLIKTLVIGGIITAIMTLFFADVSNGGRLTLSVNGATQDQNYLNGYMLFAFAFFMNKAIVEKKFLYLIPSVGLLFFTLMTGSRGSLLAFAVVVLMIFVINMFSSPRMRIGIILTAIIICIIVLVGYQDFLLFLPEEIAIRFTPDYIANYKGTNRSDLWIEILKIYKEGSIGRQLFGYGYGTVPTVNTFNHLVAHNLWLDHLITGGIFGLIVMICMHVIFLREAWRNKNAVIFATYSGYLTMCMTLSLTNYKPLWNAMMIIMILHNVNNITKEKK